MLLNQICNEGRQNALSEILEILTVVCETHNLPLAQTWVPCRHRSVLAHGGGFKKSCSSFDGSCMGQVCMSTTEVAAYTQVKTLLKVFVLLYKLRLYSSPFCTLTSKTSCLSLQDKRVYITPHVKPNKEVVASLVTAVHGQV